MTELPQTQPHQTEPHAPPTLTVRPWYVSAVLAVCAVTLLLGGAWLFTRAKSPYPFFGTSLDGSRVAQTFSGTGDLGQPYAFAPDGKTTTAIFFGFTHCANICPLTLSYLNKVRSELPQSQQNNFKVLFVSVDPARDTPARMHDYVTYFGQGTGVTIPEPKLSEVAKAYGVGYEKAEVKGADYQINHTTATYLVDSAGYLRVLWDYTQMPQVERVKKDVQYVMENPLK